MWSIIVLYLVVGVFTSCCDFKSLHKFVIVCWFHREFIKTKNKGAVILKISHTPKSCQKLIPMLFSAARFPDK